MGDSKLVLDYDRLDASGALRGAYVLSVDGREGPTIDHYLSAAMDYVETHQNELTAT